VTERLGVAHGALDPALKGVESRNGGDRHHETDRSSDERFGDGAHHAVHGAATTVGGPRDLQLFERLHDTNHRAEQANERSIGAERPQKPQPAFESHALHRCRARHGLFHGGRALLES
jgi:hypothetical protein